MGQLFNELNKALAQALEAALHWTDCLVGSAQSRCKRYISITKWEWYDKENIYNDYVNLPRTGSNNLFSIDITKTVAVTFSVRRSLEKWMVEENEW